METRKNRFSWMVSPKSFIRLMGAEYHIMHRAGTSVLARFYLAGVSIVLILVLSILSIRYAVEQLFHNHVVEVILSVFLSTLFVFIYIFLINTFTKQQEQGSKRFVSLSNVLRTGFVVFIAFVIAKPIEIYLAEEQLNRKVDTYRHELLVNHSAKVDEMFRADLHKLEAKQVSLQRQQQQFPTEAAEGELVVLQHKIDSIGEKKSLLIQTAQDKLATASFFVYRVQQSSLIPLSWVVCTALVLLFLFPGYLIYSISEDDEYFRMKNAYERNIILSEFQAFKEKYAALMYERYGVSTEYYSVYEDPPFNTKRKREPAYKKQDDFWAKYG